MPHKHHVTTHYEILGLPRNAPQEDIHPAYIQMAQKYHPSSTFTGSTPNAKIFLAIQEARETLGNIKARDRYDRSLPPEKATSASGSGTTETASGKSDTSSSSGKKSATSGSRSGNSGVHTAPHPKAESAQKKDFDNHGHHPGPKYSYRSRNYPLKSHYPLTRAWQRPKKYEFLWTLHTPKPRPVQAAHPARPQHHRSNLRLMGLSL